MKEKLIYTIGYAGYHDPQKFVTVLQKYKIKLLIDVRSVPLSTQFSEYNRDNIKKILMEQNIYYRNFSKEFGAKQNNSIYYSKAKEICNKLSFPISKSNRVDSEELSGNEYIIDYNKFVKSKAFNEGLDKINTVYSNKYNLTCALMCSEKNPINCHRGVMISRTLKDTFTMRHILTDGTYITTKSFENNLRAWATHFGIDARSYELLGKQGFSTTNSDLYDARNVFLGWRL